MFMWKLFNLIFLVLSVTTQTRCNVNEILDMLAHVSPGLLLLTIPFEFRSAGDVHIVVSGLLCRSTCRCEGRIPGDKQSKEVEITFQAVGGKLQAAGRNMRSCLHPCFFRHGDITSEERAEGV